MTKIMRDTVRLTEEGINYVGEWYVKDGLLYVTVLNGTKYTQLGSHKPEVIAQALLRELIKEGKAADYL